MKITVRIQGSVEGMVSRKFAAQFAKLQADRVNACAAAAQKSMEGTIQRNVDRPTPFTLKAVYRSRAAKGRAYAVVMIKDTQAAYLAPMIKGQTVRKVKPVPTGWTANQFGNLPRNASKQWKRMKGIAAYKSKKGNVVMAQHVGGTLYMIATWSKQRTYTQRMGNIMVDAVKSSKRALKK